MKKIIFLLSMATVFFAACSDKEVQAPDDFTVSAAAATFKLSDSVEFNLTGNPDNIVFYSGEPGYKYDERLDFNSDKGTLIYRFASNSRSGATLPRNISVLVSTDFNGQYDEENVKAAEWTDITARATLPANTPPNNNDVASGDINITDLRVEGKPMYFAFRYVSENPTTTAQRYWNMGRMELINKVPGNEDYTLTSTMAGGMFQVVEFTGVDNTWTISAAQSANHRLIHTANPINVQADDDWVISKAFEAFATVPGKPITIKDITKKPSTTFLHKYSTPGTYKATFIAMNANRDIQREVIKEVWVTVEE
jgi:hypothetical protein